VLVLVAVYPGPCPGLNARVAPIPVRSVWHANGFRAQAPWETTRLSCRISALRTAYSGVTHGVARVRHNLSVAITKLDVASDEDYRL